MISKTVVWMKSVKNVAFKPPMTVYNKTPNGISIVAATICKFPAMIEIAPAAPRIIPDALKMLQIKDKIKYKI